jgi:double-stranded uracil-DNA glycosylase
LTDPHERPFKPTKKEVLAARGKSVPDIIAGGLKVLFVGINPGLYTAAVGHHFARPGNRFWPSLYHAGFTSRQLSPFEEKELLTAGYGIVNIVARATARADELSAEELIEGGVRLEEKVWEFRPCFCAILGIGAYRVAFRHPGARTGPQGEKLGESRVWVLPNPSGINANYPMKDLVSILRELKLAAEKECEQVRHL